MQTTIVPMSLGDIFDRLFKLIGKTALRNLMIAMIILLPASIIFAYGMNEFFSMISQIIRVKELNEVVPDEYFFSLSKGLTVYFTTIVIFMLAYLTATVGITIVGCAEMSDQQISWSKALGRTFSIRLLRIYGQRILEYLALACLFIIPVIFIGIGAGAESLGVTFFGILMCLVTGILAVYLWVRWAFALPAIAWEDAGVIQSFGRSSFLVNRFWWRTFGILLLLNIIVQFAISIITAPIQLVALWGFISKYFTMIGSIADGASDSLELLELFDSLGTGLGIVTFVSYVLLLLVLPLISVVMYFDLRARKNEFVEPAELAEAE